LSAKVIHQKQSFLRRLKKPTLLASATTAGGRSASSGIGMGALDTAALS